MLLLQINPIMLNGSLLENAIIDAKVVMSGKNKIQMNFQLWKLRED
jgi:hypothetical protein